MSLVITSFTAALLTPLYIFLAFKIIKTRRGQRLSTGDGGDQYFQHVIRAHGNFSEYVPMGLILLGLFELSDGPTWVACVLAILLVAGRVAHAYAFLHSPMHFKARTIGMVLTFTMLGISAVSLMMQVVLTTVINAVI